MLDYKSKYKTLFILALLISACGQVSQTVDNTSFDNNGLISDSLQTFSITRATVEDFTKAKGLYKDKLIEDTLNIKKKNGIIEIPLNQPHYPPSIIFKDTLIGIEETEESQYYYLGHFLDLELYLVSGTFWEHYECYLINKESGSKTTTWSMPYLSPTSKYFANLSLPYGLEGVPNGIQIWRIEPNSRGNLSKYLELDQQIWAPDDFVWETDNSIIIKVIAIENYYNETDQPNENDFYYLRIKIK